MKFRIMRYNIHLKDSKYLLGGPTTMKVDFFRGRRGQPQTLEEFYGVNDNDWADDEQELEEELMVSDRMAQYYKHEREYDDDGGRPGLPETLEEYNADIERGIKEVASGEYLTVEELMQIVKKW